METAISKVRVWPIWKGCKRLAAVAVYEDASTGERVNNFCRDLFRDLGTRCEIVRELWPLSELRLPQLRAIAADEAAQADLLIVALHHDETLPAEVKDWIDRWCARKRSRPAVLLGLLDPIYQGTSAALRACLKKVAEQAGLEVLFQSDELGACSH